METEAMYVGIDLGGTNIKTALVTDGAKVLSETSLATEAAKGPEAVIGRIVRSAHDVIEKAAETWKSVRAVGIGSPGFMDWKAGVIISPPNLPGWSNVPLREVLSKAFGKSVALENDANAAAWGEYWAGAGRDARSLVMFTLGTGIGGGIILGDEILRGCQDLAGELGHIMIDPDGPRCSCGLRGCLESFASATATVRRFREAAQRGEESALADRARKGGDVTTRDLYEAALVGDRLAARTLADTGRYMGIGVSSLVYTINPEVFVLSGGLAKAGDLVMEPLRAELDGRLPAHVRGKTDVRFAELGGLAGAIGAAGCALHTFATSA
ncbi:MAG: ROK family protein [Planctomycetota bacterium]